VGVHKLAPEAGMFIKAKVNGVITNLLIDTGATVTLISTGFFKDMNNMPTLSPSQRDILTANGESLKVAGKTNIEIQSDTFKCLIEAVVADIKVDGILGLDFLKSQHAEIDMCNNTIKIQGHTIQLNIQGSRFLKPLLYLHKVK
jgi:predicted aspartyl protease